MSAAPETPRRTLLVDTHSLFFRAFHALPAMATRAGRPTSALYGLSVWWLKLLREQRPAAVAFALDAGQPTFRHLRSPSYKAQRPPVPELLREQLAVLPRLLAAFGAPRFVAPGFEADDVLATLARTLAAQGALVRVVSGDHDLFQVVDERVDVLFVGARGQDPKLYDLDAVAARYGLRPAQLPSLTALLGDPTDNLPKVAGVGARTAQALVARFGDVARLLAQLDAVEPARVRGALAACAAQLVQTEELARLRADVPLSPGPGAAPVERAHLMETRAVRGARVHEPRRARRSSARVTGGLPEPCSAVGAAVASWAKVEGCHERERDRGQVRRDVQRRQERGDPHRAVLSRRRERGSARASRR